MPQTRREVIDELVRMAGWCKLWPTASASHWGEALDSAVEQGLIAERDGKLLIAPASEPERVDKVVQLDLF